MWAFVKSNAKIFIIFHSALKSHKQTNQIVKSSFNMLCIVLYCLPIIGNVPNLTCSCVFVEASVCFTSSAFYEFSPCSCLSLTAEKYFRLIVCKVLFKGKLCRF